MIVDLRLDILRMLSKCSQEIGMIFLRPCNSLNFLSVYGGAGRNRTGVHGVAVRIQKITIYIIFNNLTSILIPIRALSKQIIPKIPYFQTAN